jgi:hypothetical protein
MLSSALAAVVVEDRWPGRRQGVAQAADDQAAHQGRVAEPHLGLGRVDVDVDLGGVERHVEGRRRVAVAGQEVGIGGAQGALQQAVAHGAAVDEQVLVGGVAAVVGGQADEA